jgi:hypothetical protein
VGSFDPTVGWLGRQWSFPEPSRKRLDAYADAAQMDATNEDVATALDILADNATNPEQHGESKFTIVYPEGEGVSDEIKQQIDALIKRTRLQEKIYSYTRETLLYGDLFNEYVINSEWLITRLMYLPPDTMIRNEDDKGRLLPGASDESSAFTQIDPENNQPVAQFYWWQVEHTRWGRKGNDKYGRSLLYTARTSWRKLRAMEEAIVINWLTRAFSRLLFIVDVTNQGPAEARKTIADFQKTLSTQKITSGVQGSDNLTVVKDIFIGRSYTEMGGKVQPGQNDVKVLDTSSTGFWNLAAVEYFQQKILTALRVPKAHLGLEKDINAKATLSLQDKRFARTIRRIQDVMGELVRHTIEFQLRLLGIDPEEVPFEIQWPTPEWMDELDTATALYNIAQAAERLIPLGVIDAEHINLYILHTPRAVWEEMKKRIEANPPQPVLPAASSQGDGAPRKEDHDHQHAAGGS